MKVNSMKKDINPLRYILGNNTVRTLKEKITTVVFSSPTSIIMINAMD